MTSGTNLGVEEIIDWLGLQAHPEGGFYAETYRSEELIPADALPDRYGDGRAFSTAIYYLLTPETCSAMHRVKSDEIFHFYHGDPIEMLHLYPDGSGQRVLLGNDLAAGEVPQVLVPRAVWQGARLVAGGRHALMGTTVAPGFDFADFEFGDRAHLVADYPEHADLIGALASDHAAP